MTSGRSLHYVVSADFATISFCSDQKNIMKHCCVICYTIATLPGFPFYFNASEKNKLLLQNHVGERLKIFQFRKDINNSAVMMYASNQQCMHVIFRFIFR